MLKAYLQAVADVGEGAARRAAEAARQALTGFPGTGDLPNTGPGAEELGRQGAALLHELMARTRPQREALRDVVRAEFETLVSQTAARETTSLAAQLAASQARVRELERELAKARGAVPTGPTQPSASPRASAARATTKAAAAKRATKTAPAKGGAVRDAAGTSTAGPAKVTPARAPRKTASATRGAAGVRSPGTGGTTLGAQRVGARSAGTDGPA